MLFRRLVLLLAGLSVSWSAVSATAPTVLTTIKPLQLIAAAVLDGVDAPGVLLPPGASPHSYALRPSDRRAVLQAERIYWVGPDLEMFVERLLNNSQTAVELMDIPQLALRDMRQTLPGADNHSDSPGAQAHQHEHGHEHTPGSLDAHIWLDPHNALTIARYMADDLQALYPDQAGKLTDNLTAFESRLTQLDTRLRARFEPLHDKPYFVFHDGYGYFEDHYNLAPRGIFSLSHEVQPGARHINALREQLQQAGPACVFSEPQFTPRLVDTLTRDLPIRKAELDPLGSEIKVDARGYEALLEGLADQLAGCLEKL
ncbi:zinc ABC transporter substrate-binding protein ZnuA [Pseudomonas sp. OIL-1]|uniref:zinc ABC transporter substrate-binding protein ZnuA n=1 Tax=Pseudomonas sp. OIL-1 TaxID=2706126 RepID=UPI0013A75CCB|nr:zinc ABC transporter substrate-binding protein ZnuA [Pseudomonas sp. OIL-1]QIB50374.1 zinc ABC transporter substrate-binding protein ZnuA [Pseudomonas sp. OIL-1]